MAHRAFTLALTSSYQNLLTLIKAVTGATPTDGFLPDRVRELKITPAVANSTSAILISDTNSANVTGSELVTPGVYQQRAMTNSIFLGDYTLKGSSLACTVEIEYT